MICYLCNDIYNKSIFMLSNIIVVVALYLTNMNSLLKILVFLICLAVNYKDFLACNVIKAFYLTTSVNKSILLTKKNKQIKVSFIRVSYFSSIMIVLSFANKLKKFNILVIKCQVRQELFKSLIILARYSFVPNLNIFTESEAQL